LRVGIRKSLAYVTQTGCAEQSVRDGVQQHVGIAVAQQSTIKLDGNTAQH